jgi:hypothetical protein
VQAMAAFATGPSKAKWCGKGKGKAGVPPIEMQRVQEVSTSSGERTPVPLVHGETTAPAQVAQEPRYESYCLGILDEISAHDLFLACCHVQFAV